MVTDAQVAPVPFSCPRISFATRYESRLPRHARPAREHHLRRLAQAETGREPGAGQDQGGRRQSDRYLHPLGGLRRRVAQAVCGGLRSGRGGRCGRPGRDEVLQGGSRLGQQPGPLGAPRHVCRICRRRPAVALSNARRSLRSGRGRRRPGGDHGAPGPVPRGAVEVGRVGVRPRGRRRRRLVRDSDGQDRRRAGDRHRRQRAERAALPRAGRRRSAELQGLRSRCATR